MRQHLSAFALALLSVSAREGVAQKPVFTTRTEVVRVDVLVTHQRRPVRGLGAADFEVLDNGVPQTIDRLLTAGEASLDARLVLDESGSVRRALPRLLDAAGAFTSQLTARDRWGVLTFRHGVSEPSGAAGGSMDPRRIAGAGEGFTSLRDAIAMALALRNPSLDRALVLVFSDGQDTMSWLSEQQVTASAARSDAVIYAVMPGDTSRWPASPVPGSARSSYLEDLVGETAGRVIRLERERDIVAAFREVLEETRARYVLTYYPRERASLGWHELRVKLKHRRGHVHARRGYFVGAADR